jgi:glutamate-1-semialdehyde 2,1-aminomutase
MEPSELLFGRASKVIPGGVNSPVRAFQAVGGTPRFMARAEGPWLESEDGSRFIDCYNSWGPMILGYGHPAVVAAVSQQATRGMSFGAPTRLEVEMAELVCELVPSVEMVRMVNSGTEACMSAIRLARAVTGREKIIKFEGCYHGHGDAFLSRAGSGAATLGIPTSPGVPPGAARATLNARYNDLESVSALFQAHSGDVAALIVEPVAGNMGCIPTNPGFLQGLRDICTQEGTVLIFDEVMTGFRLGLGGAQERYGVLPDLTTLGKIIGGGLPVGAYGGTKTLMQQVAPAGPVYQAGTLSGNPLGMAAGLATLRHLKETPRIYLDLEEQTSALAARLKEHIRMESWPVCVNQLGSMITVFFQSGPVSNWDEASRSNQEAFAQFFHAMLTRGFHLPPSQYESWFLSAAMTNQLFADLERAVVESVRELHEPTKPSS